MQAGKVGVQLGAVLWWQRYERNIWGMGCAVNTEAEDWPMGFGVVRYGSVRMQACHSLALGCTNTT